MIAHAHRHLSLNIMAHDNRTAEEADAIINAVNVTTHLDATRFRRRSFAGPYNLSGRKERLYLANTIADCLRAGKTNVLIVTHGDTAELCRYFM